MNKVSKNKFKVFMYNQQFQKAQSPFRNCREKYKAKDKKKQPLIGGCLHIRSLADPVGIYL